MLPELNLLTIFIFVLILSVLIFVHELGHFITAKRAGITVEEFSIGFPPRLVKVWQDLGKITLNGQEYVIGRRTKVPKKLDIGSEVTIETKTLADGKIAVTQLEMVPPREEGDTTVENQPQPRLMVEALEKPTEYTINWIPFGGYVKMVGEEDPTAPGSFASKSKRARFVVLAAGAGMNLIAAVLTFTLMFMTGTPEPITQAYIMQVAPESPADQAGILAEDIVLQVDAVPVTNSSELADYIREHRGEEISLQIERDSSTLAVDIVPRVDPPPNEGAIGVVIGTQTIDTQITKFPLGRSLAMGTMATGNMIYQTFTLPVAIVQDVIPAEQARPVGPVGIFNLTDSAVDATVETGLLYPILLLTAILSTALAITNLLPLPALDGGRILFILIEAIRGKRVSPEKEGAIHFIGLALLLTLMVIVSYNDVVNPIDVPDWPGLFN